MPHLGNRHLQVSKSPPLTSRSLGGAVTVGWRDNAKVGIPPGCWGSRRGGYPAFLLSLERLYGRRTSWGLPKGRMGVGQQKSWGHTVFECPVRKHVSSGTVWSFIWPDLERGSMGQGVAVEFTPPVRQTLMETVESIWKHWELCWFLVGKWHCQT